MNYASKRMKVTELLDVASTIVDPDIFALLNDEDVRNTLVDKNLYNSTLIQGLTYEQLVHTVGFSPGVAAALRATFPNDAAARVVEEKAFTAFLRVLLDPACDLEEPRVLKLPDHITVPDFKATGDDGLSGMLIRQCWPSFRDVILKDKYNNLDWPTITPCCQSWRMQVLKMSSSGIPEEFHKVLYIEPRSESFQLFQLVFASSKVTTALLKAVKQEGEQMLTRVFDALQAGQLFGGRIINARLDTERTVSKAVSTRADDISLRSGQLLGFDYKVSTLATDLKRSWQQEGAWQGRTLLVPRGANFSEVDAVLLPARPSAADADASGHAVVDMIELFQFPVSRNNTTINRSQLGRVLAALPAAKKY
ncbi:hypothetical protein JKP88DRAFT_268415, partial [Tribonema minus]